MGTERESLSSTRRLRDFDRKFCILAFLKFCNVQAGDNTLTLYKSRLLFDKLLVKYGDAYELSQLKADSELVTNPDFENGVILKIQKEPSARNKLTAREKNAVSRYLKINLAAADEGIQEEEVIEREREQRRRVAAAANAYLPTACFISV